MNFRDELVEKTNNLISSYGEYVDYLEGRKVTDISKTKDLEHHLEVEKNLIQKDLDTSKDLQKRRLELQEEFEKYTLGNSHFKAEVLKLKGEFSDNLIPEKLEYRQKKANRVIRRLTRILEHL